MPVSDTDLNTAYDNAVGAYDTLVSNLEAARAEEESIVPGAADSEYQMASQILADPRFRAVQQHFEDMRAESA
jgi:hypothetical protein